MATVAFKRNVDVIMLVGETKGHLGQSIYLREIEGREEGAAPRVHLPSEKRNGDFVRLLIEAGGIDTVHDISDGGLLVALAEMCMAGGMGANIALPAGSDPIPFLFGEDQGRYVVAFPSALAMRVCETARNHGVPHVLIGCTAPDTLLVEGVGQAAVAELKTAHEGWFPAYMTAVNAA
jgi:phosphoribosylformylglycinamidine (FGAM) synthase-like enzyme